MIERRGNFTYSVTVQDEQGKAFPEVVKDGVTYVVARPSQLFTVRIEMKAAGSRAKPNRHSAGLLIDGESVGYRHKMVSVDNQGKGLVKDCTFRGWRIDHLSKRAFKFGQTESASEEESFLSPTQWQVGTLEAKVFEMVSYACQAKKKRCSECEFKGFGKALTPRDAKQASSVRKSEGKKFFTSPSLTAESGPKISNTIGKRETVHQRQKRGGPLLRMKLRFETAPILALRKVLDLSNPEHAKLLHGAHYETEGGGGASRSQTAEEEKPQRTKLGNKEAGSSQGLIKTEPVKEEAKVTVGGNDAKRGREKACEPTVIETVDLTEDDGNDEECLMYTVKKKPRPSELVLVD